MWSKERITWVDKSRKEINLEESVISWGCNQDHQNKTAFNKKTNPWLAFCKSSGAFSEVIPMFTYPYRRLPFRVVCSFNEISSITKLHTIGFFVCLPSACKHTSTSLWCCVDEWLTTKVTYFQKLCVHTSTLWLNRIGVIMQTFLCNTTADM